MMDPESRHGLRRSTEHVVDRRPGLDHDGGRAADHRRSGGQPRLLQRPGERLRQGLRPDVAARLRPSREGHEGTSGSKARATHGLRSDLHGERRRQQLLERRVVEPAVGSALVAKADAVDGRTRREPLRYELVEWAPRFVPSGQPAQSDSPAGVVHARGDHFRVVDPDDPSLATAESGRRQDGDDTGLVTRWIDRSGRDTGLADTQASVEGIEHAGPPLREQDRGLDESLQRRSVRDELVEVVDHGQPLGDLPPCPALLADQRSHVATVAR